MDCTVHGVTKSQTRLSDFHFHFGGNTKPARTNWRETPLRCSRGSQRPSMKRLYAATKTRDSQK